MTSSLHSLCLYLSCLHPHQCLLNVIAFDFSAGNSKVSHPSNLFRRFVWNFFRLENEHLNNCGEFRAVRDISVAPLNADDQTLLEQMMDQEDGVRNRQGKKYWKRSYSMSLRRPLLSSQYVIDLNECFSIFLNLLPVHLHFRNPDVLEN